MNKLLRTGRIVRAHGVRGSVKVIPMTDDPHRFLGMRSAFLETEEGFRPILVKEAKLLNDGAVLTISGIESREEADRLRDAYVCVDRENAAPLSEGRYYIADLIGCTCVDTEGREYGKITEVRETPANDVYVIGDGVLIIPALKKLFESIDPEEGRIVVRAEVLREVGLFAD